MGVLAAVLACAGTFSAALAIYYWRLGNHNIILDVDKAHHFRTEHKSKPNEIHCSCLIPLINTGQQQGMVNNVFCQTAHYGKIMEDLKITAQIYLVEDTIEQSPYWRSLIIQNKDHFTLRLTVEIQSNIDIAPLIQEIPSIKVAIYYQLVGRKGIQWKMAELSLPLEI